MKTDRFRKCHTVEGGRLVMNPDRWVQIADRLVQEFNEDPCASLWLEIQSGLHAANAYATHVPPDKLATGDDSFQDRSNMLPDYMQAAYVAMRSLMLKHKDTNMAQDALEIVRLSNMETAMMKSGLAPVLGLLRAIANHEHGPDCDEEPPKRRKREKPSQSDLPAFEAPDSLEKLFGKRPDDVN